MATYFEGGYSEIQGAGEGVHTLYLMNPYSDTQQQQPNMLFGNTRTQQHQFVCPDDPSRPVSEIHGMVPRVHHYWGGSTGGELRLGKLVQLSPQQHDMPAHMSRNSASSVSNVLLGSNYLKATQELLDQVVNVGMGIIKTHGIAKPKPKTNKQVSTDRRGAELSTAQRQELQMNKAKLVTMLDEVEQRYRQYKQQMQIVVSSFEQAVSIGSAKSYTALPLHTISKQFRCLKDAISLQIKATSKSLGEDYCLGAKVEGSRLRKVDHQLRQHNAWRPQRGLPERAVSVLRAWLFEHFLHPYPKDSDKIMLAKQTGLTRSQVSNWFINARVRLWKPMVEEIYMEEVKEREQNGSEDKTNPNEENGAPGSKPSADQEAMITKHDQSSNSLNASYDDQFSNASPLGCFQGQSGIFNLIGTSDIEAAMSERGSPNKPMQNSASSILSMDMDVKGGESTGRRDQFKFGNPNDDGCFGAYPIGRFSVSEQLPHGNGASLTLGLPHCDNLAMSGTQQNYLQRPQAPSWGCRATGFS